MEDSDFWGQKEELEYVPGTPRAHMLGCALVVLGRRGDREQVLVPVSTRHKTRNCTHIYLIASLQQLCGLVVVS